eukprot:742433-Prymnesium_polylepis.1
MTPYAERWAASRRATDAWRAGLQTAEPLRRTDAQRAARRRGHARVHMPRVSPRVIRGGRGRPAP